MDSPAPKIREASLVHRLFGFTPGYAPEWAYFGLGGGCGDSCGGWIVGLGLWVLLIGSFIAAYALGWCAFPCVAAPLIAIWAGLTMRFENRERFGRARLYRRECVWCGRPDTAPATNCPACGRRT